MAPAATLETQRSTPRLSEVARHLVIPSGIVTTGWPRLQSRLADMSVTFDPWQAGAWSVILGKRADGKYACTVGGVVWSIPRQVGKTFSVGSALVAMCIEFPGYKVLWTAHRTRTATSAFRSLQALVKRKRIKPHLAPGRNDGIRAANGEQEIAFRNGSVIMFGAREQGFGRGFDEVDAIVFDEGQILTEKALEDMVASTNQSRHPHGALLFYMGTPPRPVDPGEAFTFKRSKALSGKSDDMIYLEFSADRDAGLDDRVQWAKANPSFPHRTPLESMLRLRENLPSDDAWRREALGIWDEESFAFRPIPMSVWTDTARDLHPAGAPMFFVTIAKELRSASVMVAAMHEGVPHVGFADYRPGVSWLTGRLVELAAKYPAARFGAYQAGPVKSWLPTLAEAGIDLQSLNQPDTVSACAHLKRLADNLAFTHSPDPVLTESLRGSVPRELDGGGWVWDWKKSEGDLAPLAGATGALWLLEREPSYDLLQSVF